METINKITLEQLAVFLPYGLKGLSEERVRLDTLLGIYGTGGHSLTMCCRVNNHNTVDYGCNLEDFKPALRPLSDYADIKISESLEANEYTRAEIYKYAHGDMELGKLRYDAILTMARNHIDIFNWIPQGLAVNLNTIER